MFPFLSLKKDVASPTAENVQLFIRSGSQRETVNPQFRLGLNSSLTEVSDASCSSNAVDILLYVAGQVKVDDMLHVGDVQTPSGNLRRRK